MGLEGFVRVDTVRASSKGRGQGANLNIPARVYEALGRPTTFALYVDGRGRILLEPLRELEGPRVIEDPGAAGALGVGLGEAALGEAVVVMPSRFKEELRGLGGAVRVALKGLPRGETLALVDAGGRRRLYRIPLGVEETLRETLEALGVEGEPRASVPGNAVILVEVDGLKARLYLIPA